MRKKSLGIVLAALALICALLLSLAGCGDDNKNPTPDDPTPTPSGEEAGVYYFDAGDSGEYLLTLGGNRQYTLAVKSDAESGSYTLSDGTLTLTAGSTTRTATLDGNVITLTYNDAQLRLLKKIFYTVTYHTDGGSAVASASVLNGKTLKTPADPAKDGFVFLGWYTDSTLKTPFAFGSAAVTGDMTLYARFAPKSADAKEYTVHYDLGYDGATLADAATVGGKLYDAATPARDGYTFVGWWLSDTASGRKLTSRFVGAEEKDATVFTEDTTLYAVWQKADAATATPAVSVNGKNASWDSVGAAAYLVTVTAPDGTVIVNAQRTTGTTFALNLPEAGEYKIEVVAVNAGGTAISDVATRYYTHLALARVGDFFVTDSSVLVFRGADGAEHYYITVDCGNPAHTHAAFDNGTSLCYNFSGCEMKRGGITFTVTATAKGRASSTVTFVYERHLDAVTNLTVNGGVLSWDAVTGATYYLVKIGDTATLTVRGTELSLLSLVGGDYTVSVTPVTSGYNSPDAATLTFTKATPAVPKTLRLVGTLLSWDAVPGATSYEVKFAGVTLTVPEGATSVDLAGADIGFAEGSDYALALKVVSDGGSAEKSVTVRYHEMTDDLTYAAGKLTWTPVLGAETYEVQVGDGEILTVSDGSALCNLDTLEKAGENTLRVRFKSGTFTSEWKEITVTAYAVTLDSRGGTATATLYKAVGDPMTLPAPVKDGYLFSAWYNVPGGAESNGKKYADPYFASSGEIVLYAYYTPKSYTLHLSKGDDSDTTATVYYGKNYRLEVPATASATTSFGGWYSAPNGTGIAFTDPEGNSLSPWEYLDDDVTLYAFWVDNVLAFEKIGSGYAVSAGPRIDLVTSVTVPATYRGAPVLTVVSGAFANCDTITEIRLPDTLTDIAEGAFDGCEKLAALSVYSTGAASSRYSAVNGVLFDSGTSDARHAPRPVLMPAAMGGVYTVPAGTDVIPRRAFAGSKLTKIIIPTSVREIEAEAFAECELLNSVVFENAGATSGAPALTIGERVFLNCDELTSIVLPARLGRIALTRYTIVEGKFLEEGTPNAFEKCDFLAEVSVAKGHNAKFTSEDGVLFGDYGTTLLYYPCAKATENYTIPDGVVKIAETAFSGCGSLKGALTIPGRVGEIGIAAFKGVSGISSLTFGGGLTATDLTIADYAFDGHRIMTLTFEEGSMVRTIGAYAFRFGGSYSQQKEEKVITLPASLNTVGDGAFADYGKLSVTFAAGDNTLSCGNNVFSDCEIGTLSLPKNMTALPNFFFGLSVENIVVDPANPVFLSENGVLYTKNGEGKADVLVLYPASKSDASFEIPNTVTAIASGAFLGAQFSSVTIPSSVTSIGEQAFYYTPNLTSVTIPASVTYIGEKAFAAYSRYTKLKTVTFEDGEAALTIGAHAFDNQKRLTAIVLPARAKTIGDYAFYNTQGVTTLSLGGVETIGAHAFDSCYYAGEVIFPATLKSIGESAFYCGSKWGGGSYSKITAYRFAEGSQLEFIGANAFENGIFETFTIPASVKTVSDGAFYNAKNLATLTFEDGDTPLVFGATDKDSFSGVLYGTAVTGLSFPSRLVEIGRGACAYSKVAIVSFGENSRLTTIGASAFMNAKIKNVTIPASVKNTTVIGIGNDAFSGCPLESVTFAPGTEPLTFGKNAFSASSVEDKKAMTSVTLPARLAPFTAADGTVIPALANGRDVFNWQLASFAVESGSTVYAAVDGVLYNADKTELFFCPLAKAGALTIPATVKKIDARAFNGCQSIASVTFADGSVCEEIGDQAFYWCKNITTLVIPDSVAKIGKEAFVNCQGLESLTLPAAMTTFDKDMIKNCVKLTNLEIGGGANYKTVDGVLFTADGKTMIFYLPTLTATTYTVPEGVETIGEKAFNSNTSLTSVSLPSTLREIGKSAFSGCNALTEVTFAPGTAPLVIGYNSFAYTKIPSFTVPARTVSIEGSAFNGAALTELHFEQGSKLGYIGDSAFSGTKIASLELPAALREIGDSAFARCAALTSVTISDGIVRIGESLFASCTALESVTLPSSLTALGNFAFKECTALRHVTFGPDIKITVLHVGTFAGCTALESIEIPASMLEIPDADKDIPSYDRNKGLFEGCTSLRLVTFAKGSKCTKIGAYAFKGTAIESFTIPESVSTIGEYAFGETRLVNITLPNTVTSLGSGAFERCESLAGVTLGNGIRSLPYNAFSNCPALREITLPASVTTVDSGAFYNDDDLTIKLAPDSRMNLLKGILYDANWNICIFPATVTEYEIPEKLTKLPDDFFDSYGGIAQQLRKITVAEGNTSYVSEGGVLYTADKSKVLFINDTVTTFELTAKLLENNAEDLFAALNAAPALTTVTVASDVTGYQSVGGVLYTADWEMAVVPSAMTEFVIPKQLPEIGYDAFRDNTSLITVSCEARGESDPELEIASGAFSGATSLKTVTLPGKVTYISSSAFYGCSALTTLNLPYLTADDSLDLEYDILEKFYDCKALEAVNVAESAAYKSIDGVVFRYDEYEGAWLMLFCPPAKKTFTIPATLEVLPSLSGCEFTTVTFEKNEDGSEKTGAATLEIEGMAFAEMTSLTTLELPSRLSSIGDYAFSGCTALSSFTIPATLTYVGSGAFENWTAEQTITVDMTKAEVEAEMAKTDGTGIFAADWLDSCLATVNYKTAE